MSTEAALAPPPEWMLRAFNQQWNLYANAAQVMPSAAYPVRLFEIARATLRGRLEGIRLDYYYMCELDDRSDDEFYAHWIAWREEHASADEGDVPVPNSFDEV